MDAGKRRRTRVYVAGPYTKGDVAVNVREAVGASNELLKLGYAPYCPHLTHFWHMLFPGEYRTWTDLDNEWVACCDAMLRIPGESGGADDEVEVAKSLGIPVFFSVEELAGAVPFDIVDARGESDYRSDRPVISQGMTPHMLSPFIKSEPDL